MEAKNYIIYPEGQKWSGVDGKSSTVDQEVYQEFINFLEEYFTGDLDEFWEKYGKDLPGEERKKGGRLSKTQSQRHSTESNEMNPIGLHASTYDENTRAIPGGRYGCAQFVKS